jgi:hypothetical protein
VISWFLSLCYHKLQLVLLLHLGSRINWICFAIANHVAKKYDMAGEWGGEGKEDTPPSAWSVLRTLWSTNSKVLPPK